MLPFALILFIALAGVVLFLLGLIPMDATIARILNCVVGAIVVVVVVLWFFSLFGVGISDLKHALCIR